MEHRPRPTNGCTRTAAPRFSFNAPGSLDAGFAASARSRRRSVILCVRLQHAPEFNDYAHDAVCAPFFPAKAEFVSFVFADDFWRGWRVSIAEAHRLVFLTFQPREYPRRRHAVFFPLFSAGDHIEPFFLSVSSSRRPTMRSRQQRPAVSVSTVSDFIRVIVAGEAALPGAVPHLFRSAKSHAYV
jgi:hypothetical protein